MHVFPAVDILGGQCAQLVQGKRESASFFGDPRDCALKWIREGADRLHVVNLDGAFGVSGANVALIEDLIAKTGVYVQLGGGIRSYADASGWLDAGVSRVILGTVAVQEPSIIAELSGSYGGERVMAGVDAKDGQVVIRGWEEPAGDYLTWAARFVELGAGSLLFTNVDVEGLQRGIQPGPVTALINAVSVPVVVAGGVSSAGDVATIRDAGAEGVVLGSSLYHGKITLRSAMEAAR